VGGTSRIQDLHIRMVRGGASGYFFFSFLFSLFSLSSWFELSLSKLKGILSFLFIEFGPQFFNFYWFCFEPFVLLNFFLISSISFWFQLIIISNLIIIFLLDICFESFFIWLVYQLISQNLVSFYFYVKFSFYFFYYYLFWILFYQFFFNFIP
jgi:hypothetical protein